TRISGRVVAEQDIVSAVAIEIADANNAVGCRGAAYIVPSLKGAVADRIKPDVSGRVVAKKNIRESITQEISRADDSVGRRGAADVVPTGKHTIVGHLVESDIAGRIVTEDNIDRKSTRLNSSH